jgi:hypothetical protein
MRGLVLTVALVLALTIGVSCADAGVDTTTRVRMLDTTPVTLRGVGFAAGERVRLTVSLGELIAARTLRAGVAGGFTATFASMKYGRCGPPLAVKAVGSRGSKVSWKLVPLECPDHADS